MVERSLQASPAGIQAAKKALIGLGLNQQKLATRLGVTRQPISKFFNQKSVDRNIFVQICETLKLDWQEITEQPKSNIASAREADIDALVQAVREQIKPLIKERCGTMRVLDMTQPIALTGEQGIYTNVNILEKITGRRRLGIEELLQGCDLDEFDRFGLSRVTEKRVPGLEAVERYSKLMVLGKPGAGKTTFLKYLAMQCIEGNFQAGRAPFFITLKDFAEAENEPGLPIYINQCLIPQANELVLDTSSLMKIFQQGRALILLDGLDEVREEDVKRVLQYIQVWSEQFHRNQFVLTCRIAAKEYTFQQFTEVEVADFDDEQIRTFVGNWFKHREPQNAEKLTERLIKELEEYKPIKELASNPLLLTLLCLEFEELLEFPTNRAELYNRGLSVLLSKWDTNRRIERDQVYKRLSLKRKEDLLSQVALTTFERKDYFFKQKTLESYIADYISNLPDAQTDPEALLLDSEVVLKSIESQHGLLIERAKGIYSFSHLTFQEYFTAREIVTNSALDTLMDHLNEKRWREVILLSVGMLRNTDTLLRQIKQAVDWLVAPSPELQRFLVWSHDKATTVQTSYKVGAVRAFYLEIHSSQRLLNSIDRDLEFACICVLRRFGQHRKYLILTKKELDLDKPLEFDYILDLLFRRYSNVIAGSWQDYYEILEMYEIFDRICYLGFALKLDLSLRRSLQDLKDQLPDPEGDREVRKEWWRNHGSAWTEELRAVMIEHRNIGHDWQFSDEQKQLLQQYYDANKLLVDCLNSDCYVSREVRQEIEDTLLLPIAEIEKYKAAKAAQQSD